MLQRFWITLFIVMGTAALLAPVQAQDGPESPAPVAVWVPEVLTEVPHDTQAFTQGFIWHEDMIYESTGRYGQSSLREVDPATGEVLRMVPVGDEYFAEGLALVDDRLIQLTWKAGIAFIYDRETFEQIGQFTYTGEGWGLCYDGDVLYMTDGTPYLFQRDPETFEVLDQVEVTLYGLPVDELNEITCTADSIYANIWNTDFIVQIDKTSGVVQAVIVADALLTETERQNLGGGGTLNGITYNEDTGTFWITGKLFPKMFEVEFVPR